MFDPVNFEHERVVVRNTRESVLPDAEFLEWATAEGFEIVVWVTLRVVDNFVELRDESVLNMVFEVIKLLGSSGGELPCPLFVVTRHPCRHPSLR